MLPFALNDHAQVVQVRLDLRDALELGLKLVLHVFQLLAKFLDLLNRRTRAAFPGWPGRAAFTSSPVGPGGTGRAGFATCAAQPAIAAWTARAMVRGLVLRGSSTLVFRHGLAVSCV